MANPAHPLLSHQNRFKRKRKTIWHTCPSEM
jgi:hypothetical protein